MKLARDNVINMSLIIKFQKEIIVYTEQGLFKTSKDLMLFWKIYSLEWI